MNEYAMNTDAKGMDKDAKKAELQCVVFQSNFTFSDSLQVAKACRYEVRISFKQKEPKRGADSYLSKGQPIFTLVV